MFETGNFWKKKKCLFLFVLWANRNLNQDYTVYTLYSVNLYCFNTMISIDFSNIFGQS